MVYDAVIIGGGHNGLIAAAYLAKARRKVLVLERRDIVGGACVTEEVFPGYKVSTGAYVCSLLRPEIWNDLKLNQRGVEVLLRDPSSFQPLPDNRHLFFWKDPDKTKEEIAKFSTKDAERYEEYEKALEEAVQVLEPELMKMPPNPNGGIFDWLRFGKIAWRSRKQAETLLRLFSMSVSDFLNRWFECEPLKSRLATDGVIGSMSGPDTPGTAYILLHHVMGQVEGQRGTWGYIKGGMGSITQAIAEIVEELGGEIRTEAPVERILVKDQTVTGVLLENGEEIETNLVLSNADPKHTFLKLFDPLDLSESLLEDIRRYRMNGASAKIHVATNGLPNFFAYPGDQLGPQHKGTIHLSPTVDYIEKAYQEAKAGMPSSKPMVEMCIPSAVDHTVAPGGKHLISMFVQYLPYERADGKEWDVHTEKDFVDSVFSVIREYCDNWDDIVEDFHVLTPKSIEERFGMTNGDILHGALSLDQLGFLRPTEQCSRYSTPIQGFYLCGSGSHPGGGVLGANGFLAAQRVIRENPK